MIEGADYVEQADLVITALGFEPENLPKLWDADGLEVTRWGTVKAEFTTGATVLDGVLCGGRHCARRQPCGLGDPRRARLRTGDPGAVRGAGGGSRPNSETAGPPGTSIRPRQAAAKRSTSQPKRPQREKPGMTEQTGQCMCGAVTITAALSDDPMTACNL